MPEGDTGGSADLQVPMMVVALLHPLFVVGLENILLQHPLSIEEGSVERNRVTHDLNPTLTILVKQPQHVLFEPIVERITVGAAAGRPIDAMGVRCSLRSTSRLRC